MKNILFLPVLFVILNGCSNDSNRLAKMEAQINQLESKLNDSYKPGFGEFMGNVQIHHAKLWFAGIDNNWELADFEINEIKELFGDIQKYQAERVETKTLPMIYPALDRVIEVIKNKDSKDFRESFINLTNTCNQCHMLVKYGFNHVKIPDHPPFDNQVFKKQNQ